MIKNEAAKNNWRRARKIGATAAGLYAAVALVTVFRTDYTPSLTEAVSAPVNNLVDIFTPDAPPPVPPYTEPDWDQMKQAFSMAAEFHIGRLEKKTALYGIKPAVIAPITAAMRDQIDDIMQNNRPAIDALYQQSLKLDTDTNEWHATNTTDLAYFSYLNMFSPTLMAWLDLREPDRSYRSNCPLTPIQKPINDIVCNDDKIEKIILDSDASGITKTYDFAERITFYQGQTLTFQNFSAMDPERISEIFAMKATFESRFETLLTENKDKFFAALPQILRESGLTPISNPTSTIQP